MGTAAPGTVASCGADEVDAEIVQLLLDIPLPLRPSWRMGTAKRHNE